MEKNTKYAIVGGTILLLYISNFMGFQTGVNNAISALTRGGTTGPIFPTTTTAVTTPIAPRGPFAIEFTLKAQNGTVLASYTVEFYHWDSSRSLWVKDPSATSSAAGLATSAKLYYEGQEVYIHITAVANKIGDYWTKVRTLTWMGDPFTTLQVETIPQYSFVKEKGQVTVYGTALSANNLGITLYGEDNTAISTSGSVSATSRSKASGLANMEGYFYLAVSTATWQAFGGKYDVPKTDQGHTARTLTGIFYVEVNQTSLTFDTNKGFDTTYAGYDGVWSSATASTANNKRFCLEVPMVETRDTYPKQILVYFYCDLSGLSDNTWVSIAVGWLDQQSFTDTKNGVSYAGSGANVGYTRAKTATFYVKVVA